MPHKPIAALLGKPRNIAEVFTNRILDEVDALVQISSDESLPGDTEILLSTWGMPTLTQEYLEPLPRLRAVFYAAGSVKPFVTNAFWERNILLTSAAAANAIPVTQFTTACILLSLKQFWSLSRSLQAHPAAMPNKDILRGAFGASVGLIGYGGIARRVAESLKDFHTELLVTDPFLAPNAVPEARLLSLDELFEQAEVVSLHAANLPQNKHMIGYGQIKLMQPYATFINTARGGLVDEDGLARALQERPDITAVLDVTHPEPPEKDSPLYALPNVVLSPHVAGSAGRECQWLGLSALEELKRYLAGQPPLHPVTSHQLKYSA